MTAFRPISKAAHSWLNDRRCRDSIPAAWTASSAMHSCCGCESRVCTMMYWNCCVYARQVIGITTPGINNSMSRVPQIVYDLALTAEPGLGRTADMPTWKWPRPSTETHQAVHGCLQRCALSEGFTSHSTWNWLTVETFLSVKLI